MINIVQMSEYGQNKMFNLQKRLEQVAKKLKS